MFDTRSAPTPPERQLLQRRPGVSGGMSAPTGTGPTFASLLISVHARDLIFRDQPEYRQCLRTQNFPPLQFS